mmetsp:Transcript_4750/g.10913  ORF Transcript_4750/g.10913 Transcript_4750/m.10913 type:complete len:200 (+) Transcript_4750:961-1560(+)
MSSMEVNSFRLRPMIPRRRIVPASMTLSSLEKTPAPYGVDRQSTRTSHPFSSRVYRSWIPIRSFQSSFASRVFLMLLFVFVFVFAVESCVLVLVLVVALFPCLVLFLFFFLALGTVQTFRDSCSFFGKSFSLRREVPFSSIEAFAGNALFRRRATTCPAALTPRSVLPHREYLLASLELISLALSRASKRRRSTELSFS